MAIEEILQRLDDRSEEQVMRTKTLELTAEQTLAEVKRTNGRVTTLEQWKIAHDLLDARHDAREQMRAEMSRRQWAILMAVVGAAGTVGSVAVPLVKELIR